MKNRNNVFTATVLALALAFAVAPLAQAGPRPDGGPTYLLSTASGNATREAGAKSAMPEEILKVVSSINFAPVGLTLSQTARLNLVNTDEANGITVGCYFIDANGNMLAQSYTTLSLGKITSLDYKRQPLPGESPEQLRAEVRVQVDILTYGVSSDRLRRSLEVFDNNSGATTVYMGGGGS